MRTLEERNLAIAEEVIKGHLTRAEISDKYNIHFSTLSRILLKMGLRKTKTNPFHLKVISGYRKGVPAEKLAKQNNYSIDRVYHIISKYRAEVKRNKERDLEKFQMMIKMYRAGHTQADIARLMKVQSSLVSLVMRVNGIRPQSKFIKRALMCYKLNIPSKSAAKLLNTETEKVSAVYRVIVFGRRNG